MNETTIIQEEQKPKKNDQEDLIKSKRSNEFTYLKEGDYSHQKDVEFEKLLQ